MKNILLPKSFYYLKVHTSRKLSVLVTSIIYPRFYLGVIWKAAFKFIHAAWNTPQSHTCPRAHAQYSPPVWQNILIIPNREAPTNTLRSCLSQSFIVWNLNTILSLFPKMSRKYSVSERSVSGDPYISKEHF